MQGKNIVKENKVTGQYKNSVISKYTVMTQKDYQDVHTQFQAATHGLKIRQEQCFTPATVPTAGCWHIF